jgi:hypothetical protein
MNEISFKLIEIIVAVFKTKKRDGYLFTAI